VTDLWQWQANAPLAGEKPWSTTADVGRCGVVLSQRVPGCVLGVAAYGSTRDEVRARFRAALGMNAPELPRRIAEGTRSVLWSGPAQWLVVDEAEWPDLAGHVSGALEGLAAVTDQTSARLFVRLSGRDARRTLAKVVGLDMHPDMFGVGHVAMTDLAHMPVHLWRLPDSSGEPAFEMTGARSMAGNLWHALLAAAAEYGVDAKPSG
jgi:heterotetrameric sarcosine oxidase gamma subunit